MLEVLLIAVVGLLWLQLRRKRDWYVVESRSCSDESLCSTAFPAPAHYGFSGTTLSAHGLSVETQLRTSVTLLHKDGGRIQIAQTVFDDHAAALQFFERTKELLPFGNVFQKVYLWRIVAASRRRALVVPPHEYTTKEGALLFAFPPHLWFKPDRRDEEI